MLYLVSFAVPDLGRVIGHKHVYMEKWDDGEDTHEVMGIIAKTHGYKADQVVITSVFKMG